MLRKITRGRLRTIQSRRGNRFGKLREALNCASEVRGVPGCSPSGVSSGSIITFSFQFWKQLSECFYCGNGELPVVFCRPFQHAIVGGLQQIKTVRGNGGGGGGQLGKPQRGKAFCFNKRSPHWLLMLNRLPPPSSSK